MAQALLIFFLNKPPDKGYAHCLHRAVYMSPSRFPRTQQSRGQDPSFTGAECPAADSSRF